MSNTELLADRIRSLFGLAARPKQNEPLERALQRLCAAHRLPPAQMVQRLQHDRAMLRDLASAITVPETYFFRHKEHFEYLVAMARRHRPAHLLRVLSAGCSSGAEPYSLAIAVLKAGLDAARVEIVACDVSRSAIEQARAGSYSDWELRETSGPIRDRYFRRCPNGRWQLAAEVRERVTFVHRSIQEHLCVVPSPSYDVILCRNVAVYLHPEAQQELYACMARALSADGRLLMAPTDPRPSAALFVRTHDTEPTIFGPAPAARRPLAATRPTEATRNATAPALDRRWATSDADLEKIRALADGGAHAEALRRLEPICSARPVEAHLLLLQGQIYMAAERWRDAVDAIGRSVRADPADPLARYWLVLALRDVGRYEDALAEANALHLALESSSVRVRMQDEEITAQEIQQAVRQLEEELR